ncbi:MAG: nucleotidyltransferase family protein [Haloarculaceae archaeon]
MREYPDASVPGLDVDSIVEILDEAPVTRAILFGSYARGDERAGSDVDVAVEFEPETTHLERTRARLRLIERLGATLERDDVDVVPLSEAPPALRRAVETEGVLLLGPEVGAHPGADGTPAERDTGDRFDELLAELERVV